jgi:Cu+-exporting ATPase
MHPQIVRDAPGSCPICGTALEPRVVTLAEERNPELEDMTRRFWYSVVLTTPILAFMIADLLPGQPLLHVLPPAWMTRLQFALATPVVLWGGWPFFVRGWASIVWLRCESWPCARRRMWWRHDTRRTKWRCHAHRHRICTRPSVCCC